MLINPSLPPHRQPHPSPRRELKSNQVEIPSLGRVGRGLMKRSSIMLINPSLPPHNPTAPLPKEGT